MWSWFTGGEVRINPDGTFVQQSSNGGTREGANAARGQFSLKWQLGGYAKQLGAVGRWKGFVQHDPSQSFVAAGRIGAGATTDDNDALTQTTTGHIPSLNAKATSLRFFESSDDLPPAFDYWIFPGDQRLHFYNVRALSKVCAPLTTCV
jgi:hypothetical protein